MDVCAASYDESRSAEPGTEIGGLTARLDDGDAVLDVGCGAGVPIAKLLAARYRVTGVDVSSEMVLRARRNVPSGSFLCADTMTVSLPPSSFDVVVALYSVFHLPRAEHQGLFRRVHRWLKPGGYFLCTLSHGSEGGYTEEDFFGATMYWSNYGLTEYVEILNEVGFAVLKTRSTLCDGGEEDHPLLLLQRR